MDSLAEFEFQNLDFELINEAKDEVYVKLERECRTEPFVGMKQPTPRGGILGSETVLRVKYEGKTAEYRWEIYLAEQLVLKGTTDAKGRSGELGIPLCYGEPPKIYKIKIFPPEPPKEPEESDEDDESTTNTNLGNTVQT